MAEQKKQNLSDNAKKAEELLKQYTDDIKEATEAMQRTVNSRRARVTDLQQHIYEKIF